MVSQKNLVGRVVDVFMLLVLVSALQTDRRIALTSRDGVTSQTAGNVPYEMYTSLSGSKIQFSSPALGDLDHDPYVEIVVGDIDGRIYAIKPDKSTGTLLWSFDTASALNAIAHFPSGTTILGSITIADLDGDGWQEVIVSVGNVYSEGENGGVVVLHHDGTLMPGWPRLTFDTYGSHQTEGVAKAPVVADLDGDGDLEIIVGTFDMRVYAWHHDGTWVDGWPQFVYDTVWSSPVVGDLDNDGLPEVIVGVDAHVDPYRGSIDGGALYVFNADGTLFGNFPKYLNENFNSSPALADLDADGYLDIVIGGGMYYDGTDGYKVHVIDRFGNYLPGWPQATGGSIVGSPAVADIDNDGDLEILVGSWDKKIYAWHHTGSLVSGWPVMSKIFNGTAYTKESVVAVDIDKASHPDGKLEILFNSGWEVIVLNSSGQQLTWDGTSGGPNYAVQYTLSALPAIADVDNDGKLELVAGGAASGGTNAAVYVWELPDSTTAVGTSGWPMLKRDAARSGIVPATRTNDAVVVHHTLPAHWLLNTDIECEVTLRNTGSSTWTDGSAYRLGVRSGSSDFGLASRIALPTGAAVTPGSEVTFTFTLHTPATVGFYPLQLRMVRDGYAWFGRMIDILIKVGNQPALQVLYTNNSFPSGGVQPGGIADAISPPGGYNNWLNATAFALTNDGAGYYLSDGPGGYVTWGGTAEDVGAVASAPAVQTILSPDGEGYYVINDNGVVSQPSTAPRILPAAPTFSDHRVRSFVVTPDAAGVYVLDKYGHVYTGGVGAATPLTPATPVFAQDIAIKIRLTVDAKGYYVLDRYGRVYNGGAAPVIGPNYATHIGEDWARDFALTEDGEGYYLLDKHGNIYTGGTAEPLTVNLPPVVGDASAIGLELADGRVLDQPFLAVSSDTVFWMTEFGGLLPDGNISIWNSGLGDELDWTAAVISGEAWLSVSPASGATPSTLQLNATVPQPLGTYNALVRFSTTIPTDGSIVERDISVAWHVVETLYQAYLPLAMKN